MIGNFARSVVLDTSDMTDYKFICERWDEWQAAMSEAINKDLDKERYSPDVRSYVFFRRYRLACNELILNLMYDLKVSAIKLKGVNYEMPG